MNTTTKIALLAAAIAAVAWPTQAAYNGDLILGFTGGSSSTDFELDLGSAASLTSGQTWNLGSSLSGFTLNGTSWGVVGAANPGTRTSWVTANTGLTPNTIAGITGWTKINTAVSSIYSLFPTAGPGNSATPGNADDNSWNHQTLNPTLTTQYQNVYQDPNIFPAGTGSMDFYAVTANGATPVELGSFTLDGTGTLSFTAVPEPTTYSLVAGLGLLALSLRRVLHKA
jgi:hypothetical protein